MMRRHDEENVYPLWCRLMGHRWWRPYYPADYERSWQRCRSCERCEHILRGTAEIKERWRRINEEERADGCRCGRPATHVRYYGPSASWSCEEHQKVNQWSKVSGGSWVAHEMTENEAASLARWQTKGPRLWTDVDRIRGGSGE